ncbi:MAG: AAA family ATPase [Gammaproteobacteria bacterium]|nr:AAA family ATPase [Gammaproteobacteria bacterium]
MYESFYGLKEKPFSMLPDPGFLYLSKKHQKALTLFEYGLMNHADFCVISGEIGSGKTTILRKLLENMSSKVAVGMITNTHKGFGDLMDWVLSAFGIHEKNLNEVEKHQCFIDFLIKQYAAGKTTLLIVDEAQNMAAGKLEELRMLSNINADKDQILQIILAGQPELKDTLALPELKQFVQRIAVDYHLDSLDQADTRGYIAHRLAVAGANKAIFTEEACDLIFKYSGGTPRLINLLCDTAMVYGFADQQMTIDEDMVAEMLQERMQSSLIPLASVEPPQKKQKPHIDAEAESAAKQAAVQSVAQAAVQAAADADAVAFDIIPSETAELNVTQPDFDERELQAITSEQDVEVDDDSVPKIKISEEAQDHNASDSVWKSVSSKPEEIGHVSSPIEFSHPDKLERSRFLKPMLLGLSVLAVVTLFFTLSFVGDRKETTLSTPEVNKYKKKPEPINREATISGQSTEQDVVQAIPDLIKQQLDQSQKIQQEMVLRQQEDRARMKALEEKTALLQSERDKAIANAQAEKERRAADAKAAKIAAEREKKAEEIAQKALAEAMAAARKAELLEQLRAKEKQEIAEALEAHQKKLEAAEAERIKAENKKAEAEKVSEDVRCQGATARFLSTCR